MHIFIRIEETDGLKAALQAEPTHSSIITKLRPYLHTFKVIYLDDLEIKQQKDIHANIGIIVTNFLRDRK